MSPCMTQMTSWTRCQTHEQHGQVETCEHQTLVQTKRRCPFYAPDAPAGITTHVSALGHIAHHPSGCSRAGGPCPLAQEPGTYHCSRSITSKHDPSRTARPLAHAKRTQLLPPAYRAWGHSGRGFRHSNLQSQRGHHQRQHQCSVHQRSSQQKPWTTFSDAQSHGPGQIQEKKTTDTFRNKIMEIVEDFDEKSYNNNGKPGNRRGFCV